MVLYFPFLTYDDSKVYVLRLEAKIGFWKPIFYETWT